MTGSTEAAGKEKNGRPRHKSSNGNACHIDEATAKEVGNRLSSSCCLQVSKLRASTPIFTAIVCLVSLSLSSSFHPVGLCFTQTPQSECARILFLNFRKSCRVHSFLYQGANFRTESLSNKVPFCATQTVIYIYIYI
ncbi:hypothetical protein AMECASPLE_002169 [Ameca splendens]|uniref:Transmembrane protein n=1 Tax=Ameca splendens TaxID=208324 RepID=A0ABV0XY16_9TELE